MAHLGPDKVARQFKGMVERCADCGFDLAGGLVEVVPTAHYLMGGLICDATTATELPGLFVAGEDAGGVHGANRLGGNGVANSTVFGGIAGDVMARWIKNNPGFRMADEGVVTAEIARTLTPFILPAGDLNKLRDELLDLMWNDVGILRDGRALSRAIDQLDQLGAALNTTGLPHSGADPSSSRAFNLTWHDWLNLPNMIELSSVIAHAALKRENSRGAHYREDFPNAGDLERSNYTLVRKSGNTLQVTTQPVDFTRIRPGQNLGTEQTSRGPS